MENLQNDAAGTASAVTSAAPSAAPAAQPPQFPEWSSGLPDDLRSALSKYANLEESLRAGMNAQALLGKKVETFKESDIEAYNNIFGAVSNVPKSSAEYNLDALMEGGAPYVPEEITEGLKDVFLDAGLNTEQAQKIHDAMSSISKHVDSSLAEYQEKSYDECANYMASLYGDYTPEVGQAVTNYLDNVKAKEFGIDPKELTADLQKPALLSKYMMRILADNARMYYSAGTPMPNRAMSPVDAQMRIDMMKKDPDFMDRLSAGDKDAREAFRQALSQS